MEAMVISIHRDWSLGLLNIHFNLDPTEYTMVWIHSMRVDVGPKPAFVQCMELTLSTRYLL